MHVSSQMRFARRRRWAAHCGLWLFFVLGFPYAGTVLWQGDGNLGQNADSAVLFCQDGKNYEISVEEYLKGSCYSLLPADAGAEAVKAVLVLLRTNLSYYEQESCLEQASFCYTPIWQRMRELGAYRFFRYEKELDRLLEELGEERYLIGETLCELPYFAVSAGATADGAARAGEAYAYLTSVDSAWDVGAVNYMYIRTFSEQSIKDLLGISGEWSTVALQYEAQTDYVGQVVWDGGSMSAAEAAKLLGLPSTAFSFTLSDGSVRAVCLGRGHGLGLSLYGACAAADEGMTYQQILLHYFPAPSQTSE